MKKENLEKEEGKREGGDRCRTSRSFALLDIDALDDEARE